MGFFTPALRQAMSASVRAAKPKMRPTKAALSITPMAVQRLKYILAQQPESSAIKIGLRTRGCNGLSYTMDYAEEKGKFDEEVVQDGVRVIIDSKALMSIIGTEMDFIADPIRSEFVFNNPNAKGTCGCGESFSI
eukprot:Clim_evm7s234 gene=Clim_evmTU7s234